jgi:hypothetical protein
MHIGYWWESQKETTRKTKIGWYGLTCSGSVEGSCEHDHERYVGFEVFTTGTMKNARLLGCGAM